MRSSPKDVIKIAEKLAKEFGAEGPSIFFQRKLYRPYIYGRRELYELVNGGGVISLGFHLLADEETLKRFTEAIQRSLDGALIDTETQYEPLDDRIVALREVRVKYHVE